MDDGAWTAIGLAAITINFLALCGSEWMEFALVRNGASPRPGRSRFPIPLLVLAVLCGIWCAYDGREALRWTLGGFGLASITAFIAGTSMRSKAVSVAMHGARDLPAGSVPRTLIYTMRDCSYCRRAKKLLSAKGIPFREVNLSDEPALWEECERRSGRETVPQVFFGKLHIGGCDDLFELESRGELDKLLADSSEE